MGHRTAIGLTVVMLVATVGAVPLTGAAVAGFSNPTAADGSPALEAATVATNHTENASANTTNTSMPPGALLSGVLGVTQAEFEGTVEGRAFGIAVASAATNQSKAAVISRQASNLSTRLDDLEERKEALKRARANGSISNATYNASLATLGARIATARTLANMTANESAGLPATVLENTSLNVTAIRTLQQRAANLSGPEVAAVARQIGGPGVGVSIAQQRVPANVTVGPPNGTPAGNGTAGPPNGTPAGGNQTAGPPNGTAGGNQTGGPPDNGTGGNSSGSGQGGSGSGQGGSGNGGSSGGSGSGAGDGRGGSNKGGGSGG